MSEDRAREREGEGNGPEREGTRMQTDERRKRERWKVTKGESRRVGEFGSVGMVLNLVQVNGSRERGLGPSSSSFSRELH